VAADGIKGQKGALKINWAFGSSPSITSVPTGLPPVTRVQAGGTLFLQLTDPGLTNTRPPAVYQWYRDGQLLSQTLAPVYQVFNSTRADSGTYFVVVSNSLGLSTNVLSRLLTEEPPNIQSGYYRDGAFVLGLSGTEGQAVALEATTDFRQWHLLMDGEMTGYQSTFEDMNANAYAQRFYRFLPSYRLHSDQQVQGVLRFLYSTGHDRPVVLEASPDLLNWTALQTNQPWTGTVVYTNRSGPPGRFYRVRPSQ
jgi:hypothetical protein